MARATFGSLAWQYLRYGWWKGRMLRSNLGSLRWRQAVPAVFVPALAGTGVLTLAEPPAWPLLAAVVGPYAVAVVAAAAHVCARLRPHSLDPHSLDPRFLGGDDCCCREATMKTRTTG